MPTNQQITGFLEGIWPRNKAKGLLAQATFRGEIARGNFGDDCSEKVFPGCWLVSPKQSDFYKFRFAFFSHFGALSADNIDQVPRQLLRDRYRPFHALTEFLNNAGIRVVYAVPITEDGVIPLTELERGEFDAINWRLYSFQNGMFVVRESDEFFEHWPGNLGRASRGDTWDPGVRRRIVHLNRRVLTELLLNELLFTGLFKNTYHKPFFDPYDVDSFLMSISQRHIFPMEVKEKTPGRSRNGQFFGIDAGRVMMLLRLCVPNDSNAIYLIRELDERGNFIRWAFVTLSDILMTSSWNLQAGGRGMGGQDTQTIRLPYDLFREFNEDHISGNELRRISNLPNDVRAIMQNFRAELNGVFD